MYVKQPDCAGCIHMDPKAAARDPDYVCGANRKPYPRECWDSHAREQPQDAKNINNGGPQP